MDRSGYPENESCSTVLYLLEFRKKTLWTVHRKHIYAHAHKLKWEGGGVSPWANKALQNKKQEGLSISTTVQNLTTFKLNKNVHNYMCFTFTSNGGT